MGFPRFRERGPCAPVAPENRSEVGPLFVESDQGSHADMIDMLKGKRCLTVHTAAIRIFLEVRVQTVPIFGTLIIDRN